jgi:hypothetical protein
LAEQCVPLKTRDMDFPLDLIERLVDLAIAIHSTHLARFVARVAN